MTSLAFIIGVVPLVLSTGLTRAGAEMRNAMGVAVFPGMLCGIFLTPVFYVLVRAPTATARSPSFPRPRDGGRPWSISSRSEPA